MLITSFGKDCMNKKNSYIVTTSFINPDQEEGNPNNTKFDPDAVFALRDLLETSSTFFVISSNSLLVVTKPTSWEIVSRAIPVLANCNIVCPIGIVIELTDVTTNTIRTYKYHNCVVRKTIIAEDQTSISFDGVCTLSESPIQAEEYATSGCCENGVCDIPGIDPMGGDLE